MAEILVGGDWPSVKLSPVQARSLSSILTLTRSGVKKASFISKAFDEASDQSAPCTE
jgi:hypothetical protein